MPSISPSGYEVLFATLVVTWAAHASGHTLGIILPYAFVVSQVRDWTEWVVLTFMMAVMTLWKAANNYFS